MRLHVHGVDVDVHVEHDLDRVRPSDPDGDRLDVSDPDLHDGPTVDVTTDDRDVSDTTASTQTTSTVTTETSDVSDTTASTQTTETSDVSDTTDSTQTETTSTGTSVSDTGGVGGETGTPDVTPPSTSTLPGSSGSSDGWRVILLALAGIAVLSLILLPAIGRRASSADPAALT